MMFFIGLVFGFCSGSLLVLYIVWRETQSNVGGSHYKAIFKDKNIDEVV